MQNTHPNDSLSLEEALDDRFDLISQIKEVFLKLGLTECPLIKRGLLQDAILEQVGLTQYGLHRRLVNEVMRDYFGYERVTIQGFRYFRKPRRVEK